jgi:NAD(P)-dependent dehydrogenase (short-subunit alcohol dehydrogenase family)
MPLRSASKPGKSLAIHGISQSKNFFESQVNFNFHLVQCQTTLHAMENQMKREQATGEFEETVYGASIWNGRRVAITGGTSGLGRALVTALHDSGARVAFVARNRELVERLVQEHPRLHGIVGDVSSKAEIYPLAIQILGALGGLEVLINNASSLGSVPLVPLADTNCEDLELAIQTNLLGPFRLTRALLGSLAISARDGHRPVVLNISSDAAINAYPNWGAYSVSKAGLHHLSRIWDEELASQDIRILSIDPGDMDTPLHALAVPEADPSTLKSPETAAKEIMGAIENVIAAARGKSAGQLQDMIS